MSPTAPGPYTLRNLAHEFRVQAPRVLRHPTEFPAGFRQGPGRIDGTTRVLVLLRMARLLGCPVCLNLFPKVGARMGIDAGAIRAALDGNAEGLSPEQFAAVSFGGLVIESKGELPAEIPAEAQLLTPEQRAHLVAAARVERVVHATGLMFLPHRWIVRAAEG